VSIEFKCTNCLTMLRVSKEHLGKQARCPNCQTLNTVQVQAVAPESYQDPIELVSSANPAVAGAPQFKTAHLVGGAAAQHTVAHRGGMILTMGIMAIVCNFALIPGILAWILGRADLKQMRAGYMDRTGEGITQAGMIMGIIMTVMAGISVLLIIFYFIVAIFIVGLSAAAG
jgi:hypothetical protein